MSQNSFHGMRLSLASIAGVKISAEEKFVTGEYDAEICELIKSLALTMERNKNGKIHETSLFESIESKRLRSSIQRWFGFFGRYLVCHLELYITDLKFTVEKELDEFSRRAPSEKMVWNLRFLTGMYFKSILSDKTGLKRFFETSEFNIKTVGSMGWFTPSLFAEAVAGWKYKKNGKAKTMSFKSSQTFEKCFIVVSNKFQKSLKGSHLLPKFLPKTQGGRPIKPKKVFFCFGFRNGTDIRDPKVNVIRLTTPMKRYKVSLLDILGYGIAAQFLNSTPEVRRWRSYRQDIFHLLDLFIEHNSEITNGKGNHFLKFCSVMERLESGINFSCLVQRGSCFAPWYSDRRRQITKMLKASKPKVNTRENAYWAGIHDSIRV